MRSGSARAALHVAAVLCLLSATASAHEGQHKRWLENLMRPDNHLYPQRDRKSLFCCGEADIVRTKFKVESVGGEYPEDRWYAWLGDQWKQIPPEKIIHGPAPDGQGYLFVLGNTIQCFVPPQGGH